MGILQAKILEWAVMPSSRVICPLSSVQSLSHVQLFVTPRNVALQAPLSMGILQAKILEWVAMPSSRGPSWLSCTEYVAEHALFTWLITHLSPDITCTDHVALMH